MYSPLAYLGIELHAHALAQDGVGLEAALNLDLPRGGESRTHGHVGGAAAGATAHEA